MALDEPKENEHPIRVNGVDVLIEDSLMPVLDGWTVECDREGFVFTMSVDAWVKSHSYID